MPGLRHGVQQVMRRVFGSRPAFDASRDLGDPGLCGPGSASWRVIAEPAAIAGGIRGLLVQTLHPLAMAGVADHSRFREDPLGRLARTSRYVTATTFGSTREALEVTRAVHRSHRPVAGRAPDGRPYRADEARLLTWVSCSLTSSFLTADRLWAPDPVTGADADAFVDEQSRIAALLDPDLDIDAMLADPDLQADLRAGRVELPLLDHLPRSVADLDAVMAGFEPELEVGEQAREAVAFLTRPPLPAPIRVAYWGLLAGAAGSLTPRQRDQLGLPSSRIAATMAVANTATTINLLRASVGRSPAIAAATARSNGEVASAA